MAQIMRFRRIVFWIALLALPPQTLAATGDRLFIVTDGVNVRAGPSLDEAVQTKVNKGHALVEVERDGDWVRVKLSESGDREGWVHGSLVSRINAGGKTDAGFDRFLASAGVLNDRTRIRSQTDFFNEIRNLGGGTLEVTASDGWLALAESLKTADLDTLLGLWVSADGGQRPVMLRIVDRGGELRAERSNEPAPEREPALEPEPEPEADAGEPGAAIETEVEETGEPSGSSDP